MTSSLRYEQMKAKICKILEMGTSVYIGCMICYENFTQTPSLLHIPATAWPLLTLHIQLKPGIVYTSYKRYTQYFVSHIFF